MLHAHGAELALTYQGDGFGKRVVPLAEGVGAGIIMPADVQDPASLDALFDRIGKEWGRLDFLVHAVAYSDKAELDGRFIDSTRANFLNSLDISCYSLVDLTRRAAPLMADGGSVITLAFSARSGYARLQRHGRRQGGARERRALSRHDLGPQGIRVNAISPGPMRTLAGAAIAGARKVYRAAETNAPLRANATLEAVGGAALYLASDLGACTTGEILFVDGGFHVTGMPQPENL